MRYEEATVKATYCIQVMIIELRLLAVNKQQEEKQTAQNESLAEKKRKNKHV